MVNSRSDILTSSVLEGVDCRLWRSGPRRTRSRPATGTATRPCIGWSTAPLGHLARQRRIPGGRIPGGREIALPNPTRRTIHVPSTGNQADGRAGRRDGRHRQPPARPGPCCHRDRAADGAAGCDHRQRDAPIHPAGARLFRIRPGVGGQRLHAGLRRAAAARRPGRGPARPPQGVHRRAAALQRRVAGRRVRHLPGVAARGPYRPRSRRRGHRGGRARTDRDHLPGGPPRNRAMGVYAAMSVAGGAVGLLAGGLLTTYASWRWVLFVNGPIGLAAALAAPRVLSESGRQRGRFDLPGAITGTGGLAALVYGLSNATTTPDGVSHWADAKVVASLAASVVLLAAFTVIEARSENPL